MAGRLVVPAPPLINLETTKMLISQSEVDSFLSCERKHYYAFGEPTEQGYGIEPLQFGESLSRGLLGHEILDHYYKLVMEGFEHKDAAEVAIAILTRKASEGVPHSLELIPILAQYFTIYEDDFKEWKPLAIEQEFKLPLGDTGLVFPFRVDGIFRHIPSGQMLVWDHKFLWNYYLPNSINIMPQLPKYVYCLNQLGYNVVDGMYNMISTRKNSRDPVRRIHLGLGKRPSKQRQFMREQIITMKKIREYKEMDNDSWRNSVVRTASSFNCKNCQFLGLCTEDLEERPGRALTIANFYKANTYGYMATTEPE